MVEDVRSNLEAGRLQVDTRRTRRIPRAYFHMTINSFMLTLTPLKRFILETDQDKENEEAGDMNDDKLNEVLARSDAEAVTFQGVI